MKNTFPYKSFFCNNGVKVWAYHDYYCLFIQTENTYHSDLETLFQQRKIMLDRILHVFGLRLPDSAERPLTVLASKEYIKSVMASVSCIKGKENIDSKNKSPCKEKGREGKMIQGIVQVQQFKCG